MERDSLCLQSQTKIEFMTQPELGQAFSDVVEIDPVIDMNTPEDNGSTTQIGGHLGEDSRNDSRSSSGTSCGKNPKKTGGGKYPCSNCPQSFNKHYLLLYHQRIRHCHLYPYTCDICHYGTALLPSLLKHQEMVHERNSFVCKKCAQSYPTAEKLRDHLCIEKRPFVCQGCGRGYSRFPALVTHSDTCNDNSCFSPTLREYRYCSSQGYNCRTCGIAYFKLCDLIRHRVKNHSDVELSTKSSRNVSPYKSGGECEKKRDEVASHITETAKNGMQHFCKICSKFFPSRMSLLRHEFTNHEEILTTGQVDSCAQFTSSCGITCYICNICGKLCTKKSSLTQHKNRMHLEQLEEKYTKENSVALLQSSLDHESDVDIDVEVHSPIEEEETSFACDICRKVCTSKCNLSMHKLMKHNKIQLDISVDPGNNNEPTSHRYPCNICNKVISTQWNLIIHKKFKHPEIARAEVNATPSPDRSSNAVSLTGVACSINDDSSEDTPMSISPSPPKEEEEEANDDLHDNKPRRKLQKCDECGRTFPNRGTLAWHKKCKHSVSKAISSPIASPAIPSPSSDDEFESSKISIHKCSICGRTFPNKGIMIWHRKMKHSTSSLFLQQAGSNSGRVSSSSCMCKICGKVFIKKGNLVHHMKMKHSSDNSIDGPQSVANPSKLYPCKYCDKSLTSKNHLKQHIIFKHSSSEKPYQCYFCDCKYYQKGILLRHIEKIHLPAHKDNIVNTDGRDEDEQNSPKMETKSSSTREDHSVTESDMEIRTSTPSSLPPAEDLAQKRCSVCFEVFTSNSNFNRHMKYHHGRFNCHKCFKSYASADTLRRHYNNFHRQNKKMLSCKFCRKLYVKLGTLSNHMLKEHSFFNKKFFSKQSVFHCVYCLKLFDKYTDFVEHVKCSHSISMDATDITD